VRAQCCQGTSLTIALVEREEIESWGTYRGLDLDLALPWVNALMCGQPDAEVEPS
jgi:hypothetical protein